MAEQFARDRGVTRQHFAAVDELIAALLPTSGDFAVAQGRIINADRYYREGELGAAAFELRLPVHSLQPRPVTQRPSRRRRLGLDLTSDGGNPS